MVKENYWTFKKVNNIPKCKDAILIAGMPGIGNVGKIIADFLIEELKADKIYEISSYSMPQSVFVNEQNLVELPKIDLSHKKVGGQDYLFLTGDIQPISEESCYSFCEEVLEECQKIGLKEVITVGGIGLYDVPKNPRVFCTGNDKAYVEKLCAGLNVNTQIHGVVGPIIGVSGLLLGLSKRRGIVAASLLAETLAHPTYLGVRGAKESLTQLNKKYGFNLDLKKLDKEIKNLDKEMKKSEELQNVSKKVQKGISDAVHYIG